MAEDADGNYYYDEGTISEEMDSWDVYEDADGNIGFYDGTNEQRLDSGAYTLDGPRDDPTTDDLADGEGMLYITDGTTTGTAGDLCYAYNDGGSITAAVAADVTA